MAEEDWQAGFAKSLGVFLNGRGIATPNERGEQIVDDTFYVTFNSSHEAVEFTLPEAKWGQNWVQILETDERAEDVDEDPTGDQFSAGAKLRVEAWSLALLRRVS